MSQKQQELRDTLVRNFNTAAMAREERAPLQGRRTLTPLLHSSCKRAVRAVSAT